MPLTQEQEAPDKLLKIDVKVFHVTCNSRASFEVKGSKVKVTRSSCRVSSKFMRIANRESSCLVETR